MAKSKAPVIPVKKTGKVSSHYISINVPSHVISKSTSQSEESQSNLSELAPPVNPKIAINFYKQHPYHMRAIMLKSLCVAGVGYDITPYDNKVKDYFDDEEYKRIKNFCDTPNLDGEVLEDLLTNWHIERYIHGQGYLEIVPNGKGELTEIYNIRGLNFFLKKFHGKYYYTQKDLAKEIWFQPFNAGLKAPQSSKQNNLNEVLQIKNYNPSTKYFGLPEWFSSTADLVLDRSVVEYRLREFENNLMIDFIIICEGGEIDSDGLASIVKYLSSNYKGVENAGKALYLNSDTPEVKIRIEKINKDTREAGFINTREQSRDFILVADGVPSILLGAKVKGQLGGTTEVKDMFKVLNETIIKPQKKSSEAKLNLLFKLRLGVTKFKFSFKELTIDTLKEIVDYVGTMTDKGIIDTNEARQELGFEVNEKNSDDDLLNKLYKISKEIREIKKKLNNAA